MYNLAKYGIVQGRLSKAPPGKLQWFPTNWQQEFEIAKKVGIKYIELISERNHNPKNPIWVDDGIEKIRKLIKDNNLCLYSLCNDYIIANSFLNNDVVQQTKELLLRGKKLGIKKYILPFLGTSEISIKNILLYKDSIIEIAKLSQKNNIEICLETIASHEELIEIIKLIDMPNVTIVFDTGNRVIQNQDIVKEIKTLGNLISHVHIKDSNIEGDNVILGTGLVNFEKVFTAFRDINYFGPYTFETTRGNNPVNTAKYNVNFTNFFIKNCN